jgi:hypothetical protein
MDEKLTAYCGLCCADCIPSCEELFALVDRLDQMFGQLEFDQYAKLKSAQHKEFEDYPTFLSVLRQIKNLRCPVPCRQGGGRSSCEVRLCAQSKGLKGCWECKDRRECRLLDRLRRIHPNLDYHLDLIADMGPAQWFEKRREHYVWQRKGDLEPVAPADELRQPGGMWRIEECMDISIVQASPDDAGEILALQKMAYQSEAKLNDDWTIPPLTQTLPEIMSEFETKIFLKVVCADKIIGSVRACRISIFGFPMR